ncbi:MAG TPA: lipoprotein insertase outer membrane protein LolB [Casimicrobiaceae bacterium]|nr:lipoprotein insertase outer membrane protein LolB [Casimicrobiaceae bacterium]
MGAPRALVFCALALAACATVPTPIVNEAPIASNDVAFVLAGRMSARRGDNGVAGAFSWRHRPGHDEIELSTPLGQTLAQLQGDAQEASVRLQDGRTESAPTWQALTQEAFGVTIPVEGLAYWVRAVPRAKAAYSAERDATGRVSLLRQDGWDIAYSYADDDASRLPSRLALSYPGADPIQVRIVVDRRD